MNQSWVHICPLTHETPSRPLSTPLGCYSREDNGNPLQYSCLENPMDGGAWWAAVHGVTKSWAWLSDFPLTFHFHALEKAMAAHSTVLAWRIPGTGEPGGLLSMGSHNNLAAAAADKTSIVTSGQKSHDWTLLWWRQRIQSCWAQQCQCLSQERCWIKAARHRRVHTIWSHFMKCKNTQT